MGDAQRNSAETAPFAAGLRLDWKAIPPDVRAALETQLGSPVVHAQSQASGFSPGVAARVQTANGQRFFIKAAGPTPNPDTANIHRQEIRVASALPASAPMPRLLYYFDQSPGGWVALVFEDVDGVHPAHPWRLDQLDRVLDALAQMAATLTSSPLVPPIVESASDIFRQAIHGWQDLQAEPHHQLDAWSVRNGAALAALEAHAPAAVAGNTLIHLDIRSDNMLLAPNKVWIVDWPHACVGAAWVDVLAFAPSVAMQGGPAPEDLIARAPTCQHVERAAITAVVAALAGFFTHRSLQPPSPGIPTLRAFQAAQAAIARQWVAARTGLF